MDNGEPRCIAFGGLRVDDAIETEVLRVVEPGEIEAAVQADRQQARQGDDVSTALSRDLEAARYAADRAFRQYDAMDPQNRLVTGELELRWNRSLERVRELETRIEAHERQSPKRTPMHPGGFAALASDLRTVWTASTSDVRFRKRIVRTLIQEVVADIDGEAGEIILVLHWTGGVHTELRLPRRRRGQRNSTSKSTVEAVRLLVRIADDDQIAGILNRNGLTTGHGNRWTRERVIALRSYHKIPIHHRQARDEADWMNLTEAAGHLGISPKTLRLAAEAGEIEAEHPLADGPWVFARSVLDSNAAQSIVDRAHRRQRHLAGPITEQQYLFPPMT